MIASQLYCYILDHQQEDARLRADFSKLDLSSSVYLSKNLELLSDEVDRMSSQLDRYKRFHTGGAGGGRPFMRDNRWNRRGREGKRERRHDFGWCFVKDRWDDSG